MTPSQPSESTGGAAGHTSPAGTHRPATTHAGGSFIHGGRPDEEASAGAGDEHDETEVPREARLLRDAQGKLIFIGDCAPLSWFQSVRQLVTSRVDPHAFAPQTSRYSVLENVPSKGTGMFGAGADMPVVRTEGIEAAVWTYLSVTCGLVDLFADNDRLLSEISAWVGRDRRPEDINAAVYYLVLAIGCRRSDEELSQLYFDYARDHAMANLTGNLSGGTVKALTLITLYMLGACQINGAFLFFGIAARAAYSIGIHRTEVNARFGAEIHRQRDRLWKSVRVVDLFLSTSMGRPPATSDVDCTVPYRDVDDAGQDVFDLLNASVQIFVILEGVVTEIYSRRKISLQLTEGVSRQLRDWSVRWLQPLKEAVSAAEPECGVPLVTGACQALATYYYAVMLVSRPFLMYELHRRLSNDTPSSSLAKAGLLSGKSKLADACIDAASLMVDPVLDLIDKGIITDRLPLLV